MLSTITVAFTMLQCYKYFRNIIKLPLSISLFLLLFLAYLQLLFYFHLPQKPILFVFLLVFFNYFAALKLSQEKKIGLIPLTCFSILIGGLTITNIMKVYIPVLFEKVYSESGNILAGLFYMVLSQLVYLFCYIYGGLISGFN